MTALESLRSRLRERYSIERELGRGGMGAVYLARDVRLDRPVALKVLPPEFASMPALRERFLRETRTAASFSHPNIVPVYAIEEADDLLAYAMAFVEGESLGERIRRTGPLGVRDTVRFLQDTGYALAYAHGRGVVHRDIKPDNIMIERATGRAMVMDFGIARVIAAPAATAREGLTRIGEVVGTPEYMSPEQATGDHVDGRSDLYALGLTAYFVLIGHPAFTGDTTGRILARQITEVLPPMLSLRPDLPAPLAVAIDRCVVKAPEGRFQTAEELVDALDVSQLAAPEIPLAIRMFAEEASTLSMVMMFGALIVFFMLRMMAAEDVGNDDMFLPVVMLISILLTRVTQAMGEVARMAGTGFSAIDVHRGLAAVMAERKQRRTELRADATTRRERRRTFIRAVVGLVAAVALFRMALLYRHPRPQGGYQVDLPGMVLVFSSVILLGVSLAVLLRSPYRMPIGERLFRLIWMGPFGRAFVWVAGRRVWKAGGRSTIRTTGAASVVAQPIAPSPAIRNAAGADDRVALLESRVTELERWRSKS